MSGIIESAVSIMRQSSSRVEMSATNVANSSTSGFKRNLFVTRTGEATFETQLSDMRVDESAGKLIQTGQPLDVAITGTGYFQVRLGDQLLLTRQGDFSRSIDGLIINSQGAALQQSGGGDLALDSSSVTISDNGTVLDGDTPVGRIAVVRPGGGAVVKPIDGAMFTVPAGAVEEVTSASVRQGVLEASNVSLGDEMISMMDGVRGAETGAHLVQLYDDLLGRVMTSFGQSGR